MVRDLFQPFHLLIILLVFMVLFGGKKLADVGKGLGEGIRNFKTALKAENEKGEKPTEEAKVGETKSV